MAKGAGAQFFVDVDNNNSYRDAGCIYGLTPPGYSRGVIDGEPCLGDAAAVQDTGDLTYSPLNVSIQSNPNTTIDNELEAAIKADTVMNWCIAHPTNPIVYQYGTGKMSEFTFDAIERETQMKRPGQLLPLTDWTYSATAPVLEP